MDGRWHEPFEEHVKALTESEFPGKVYINVVGEQAQRALQEVRDMSADIPLVEYRLCPNQGAPQWEQETLDVLLAYTQQHDDVILYAHNKGGTVYNAINPPWRRAMTKYVVYEWRNCLAAIDEYDAVGIHHFDPSMPGVGHPGHFGGNFWMARAEHIRTLPICPRGSRWDAEMWILQGNPRVKDVFPGSNPQWPDAGRYEQLGIR